MRLLDAHALIYDNIAALVDFTDQSLPPYAILSHTWGDEEVLFQDIGLGPQHEIQWDAAIHPTLRRRGSFWSNESISSIDAVSSVDSTESVPFVALDVETSPEKRVYFGTSDGDSMPSNIRPDGMTWVEVIVNKVAKVR